MVFFYFYADFSQHGKNRRKFDRSNQMFVGKFDIDISTKGNRGLIRFAIFYMHQAVLTLLWFSLADYDLKAINLMRITSKASVMTNGSLDIFSPILSAECLKFCPGVWIRVYQTSEGDDKWPEEATAITALSIPQKCCLVNKDAASYSIVLFPQQQSSWRKGSLFLFLGQKSHPVPRSCRGSHSKLSVPWRQNSAYANRRSAQ